MYLLPPVSGDKELRALLSRVAATFRLTSFSASIATTTGAMAGLAAVAAAVNQLASDRATVGTNTETLTDYSDQLATLDNNLSAANSQILDVDVATQSTNYARQNILVQTGTAMLAQANALPQSVLKLLA